MTMQPAKLLSKEKDEKQSQTGLERPVELSVVVPVCERHDDLRELYLRYSQELLQTGYPCEFVFVVDGPDHEALQIVRELKDEYPAIQVIALNRRFGETTALALGFEKAKGSIILTLPSYYQVEPHEIHKLLNKLIKDELDMVISWRYPRFDPLFNRGQSWFFRRLVRMLTGTRYHDILCGLRVMKRKVAEEIALYGDLHHFLPLLAYQRGFRVEEVPVQQSRRDVNRRVYRPSMYLRKLLDLLTLFFLFRFTRRPLRLFGSVGSGLFGSGAFITGYLGLYRLLGFGAIADRPLLILGVLLMVLGVQLFSIGLLGELVIFTHAREVKEYQIDQILE